MDRKGQLNWDFFVSIFLFFTFFLYIFFSINANVGVFKEEIVKERERLELQNFIEKYLLLEVVDSPYSITHSKLVCNFSAPSIEIKYLNNSPVFNCSKKNFSEVLDYRYGRIGNNIVSIKIYE